MSPLSLLQAEEIFFTCSALVWDLFVIIQLNIQPRKLGLKFCQGFLSAPLGNTYNYYFILQIIKILFTFSLILLLLHGSPSYQSVFLTMGNLWHYEEHWGACSVKNHCSRRQINYQSVLEFARFFLLSGQKSLNIWFDNIPEA